MDRHSQHLAAALGTSCPVLTTDVYQRAARQFGARAWTVRALRALAAERNFVAAARRPGLPVHLANHHLARYGPLLGLPYLVTVHDLIRHSDAHGRTVHIHPPARRDRRLLARDRRGIEQATGLIAVSRHTAGALQRDFGIPEDRIAVVYQGIDHGRFRPVASRPFADPYLLFVGSEHPRKNLGGLLEAFAALKCDPRFACLRLVKIGAAGGPEAPYRQRTLQAIARLGLQREVLLPGRVDDEELASWYAHAACLVLPSRAEGFGLPPLEAMACGCPVVVANAGALPEISGPAALLVDPDDVGDLVRALRNVLERAELRQLLRERGLAHAARFTWTEAAEQTLAAYRRFFPSAVDPDGAARPSRSRPPISALTSTGRARS